VERCLTSVVSALRAPRIEGQEVRVGTCPMLSVICRMRAVDRRCMKRDYMPSRAYGPEGGVWGSPSRSGYMLYVTILR
jgi:hypothetical protein